MWRRTAIVLAIALSANPDAEAQGCGSKRYCREMADCAEARFYLEQCGLTRLDGDSDGSPCENLCGDGGNRTKRNVPASERIADPFTCGSKTKCGQMASCEEAKFYLDRCGLRRLDGDGDGIPCNALCR